MGGVAAYRFRACLRRRLPGYVTLILVVGLAGGLSLGSLAGARRTQSAFSTYLASSSASDLQFQPYIGGGSSLASGLYSPALTARFAALPHVKRVAAEVYTFIAPLSANGAPIFVAAENNNQVNTVGSVGGMFDTVDRLVADRGRLADPNKPDEFTASAEAARLLHWHLGQVVMFGAYSFAQVQAAPGPTSAGAPEIRFRAKLVGITTYASEVAHDTIDRYPTFVFYTAALTRELLPGGAGFPIYAVQVDGGSRNVAAVERELVRAVPPGTTYTVHVASVVKGQVERSIAPISIALAVFGALAALATLLLAGQVIARNLRGEAGELDSMRTLGAGPSTLTSDAVSGTLAAVLAGTVLAIGVGAALSPFAPIGVVRRIDPSPGFILDRTVALGGLAFFAACLGAVTAYLVWRNVPYHGLAAKVAPVSRPSRVAAEAAGIGLPTSAVAGIRFALSGAGLEDSAPIGPPLFGATVAVTVVAATLTFGSGLHTLVSRPALYGWNWDYTFADVGGTKFPTGAEQMVARDPDVAAWAAYTFGSLQLDSQTVPAMVEDDSAGQLGPPIVAGHALTGAQQIVLGEATLVALHKRVGDTVVATYGSPADAPVYVPPTPLLIVGTATMPAIGNGGNQHPSMGTGAVISSRLEPAAFKKALEAVDPEATQADVVLVRLRAGIPTAAGRKDMERIAAAATRLTDADPNGGGQFVLLPVQQPAEIANYRSMLSTPSLLAGALSVGAVAALALTLTASVRRRRRDLALLKALGFVPRQLAAAVAWQSSVSVLVGLVVGLPLGAAAGRLLWERFAQGIYAVPHPTVPMVDLALIAAGALVLANAVALSPGRTAGRTPTALLLRAE